MAIYNNREVAVVGPVPVTSSLPTVTVQYMDGSHENVSLGLVKYTKEEKDQLVKAYPSQFDSIETIEDEDVKAVRLGVAPPSDPSVKEQAMIQARREAQQKYTAEQNEKAKKEADAKLQEYMKSDDVMVPVHTPSTAYLATQNQPKADKSEAQVKVEKKAGK